MIDIYILDILLYHRNSYCIPLLSGGDKETDGVIFSSNLAVLFDNDVDEPDVDEDSLSVTVNANLVNNELFSYSFDLLFIHFIFLCLISNLRYT